MREEHQMKITRSQLRRIIKEELSRVLGEQEEAQAEHEEPVSRQEWMRFGKGVYMTDHGRFNTYHDGSERSGENATKMFLKGADHDARNLIINGKGEVIGFGHGRGGEWQPHWHAPKSGWGRFESIVKSGVEITDTMMDYADNLLELPAPVSGLGTAPAEQPAPEEEEAEPSRRERRRERRRGRRKQRLQRRVAGLEQEQE